MTAVEQSDTNTEVKFRLSNLTFQIYFKSKKTCLYLMLGGSYRMISSDDLEFNLLKARIGPYMHQDVENCSKVPSCTYLYLERSQPCSSLLWCLYFNKRSDYIYFGVTGPYFVS